MKRYIRVVLVMATLSVISVQPAAATFPGNNGRLAFYIYNRYPSDIISIDPDGTDRTVLTSSTRSSVVPAWSADGSRILYISKGHGPDRLITMNPDGTDRTTLYTSTHRPFLESASWSPDGTQIAVSAEIQSLNRLQIFVLTLSDSSTSVISTRGDDSQPEWAPDGTRIAFTHARRTATIMTVSPDGTDPVIVVPNGFGPSWAPDGSHIAFSRTMHGGQDDIFVVAPEGTGLARLTDTPRRYEFTPTFSPDGSSIAFSRTVRNDVFAPDDIWIMDVDGSNAAKITDTPKTDEFDPAWQPT